MCLLVCFLSATRDFLLCGAASESESRSRQAAPRERASMHSESTRAHAVQHTSQRKNRTLIADAFQKQNRTRAHAVVYVPAEIFKKREKENQHATSQVQFTVCLLLECLLFESYRIVFFTNRVCWPPWNHGEPGDLPSLRRRG